MTVWCDEPCDTGEPPPQIVPPCGRDGLRQIPNGLGDVDDVAIAVEGVL